MKQNFDQLFKKKQKLIQKNFKQLFVEKFNSVFMKTLNLDNFERLSHIATKNGFSFAAGVLFLSLKFSFGLP